MLLALHDIGSPINRRYGNLQTIDLQLIKVQFRRWTAFAVDVADPYLTAIGQHNPADAVREAIHTAFV